MRRIVRAMIFVFPVLLLGCPSRDEAADRDAIDALRSEHVAGVNSRNADLVLDGMTEDVVYLAPDAPPVLGRTALEPLIRGAYERMQPVISMTPREVILQGHVAIEWGCLGGRIEVVGGGEPIPNEGKYLLVYRWQRDTGWRIARDVYNMGSCGV